MNEQEIQEMFDRFWSMVDKKEEGECWEWIGEGENFITPGYWFLPETFLWGMIRGDYTVGNIRSTCRNERCLNPRHLYKYRTNDRKESIFVEHLIKPELTQHREKVSADNKPEQVVISSDKKKNKNGFTFVPDEIINEIDLLTAVVYGKIWRYCQLKDGVCKASLSTMSSELRLDKRTIRARIRKLISSGYIRDLTPDLVHRPHVYVLTDKKPLEKR